MIEDQLKKPKQKKQQAEVQKKIESKRAFKQFKLYDEDDVFGPEMLFLEMMFKQSRANESKKQDEDVNSDEELITKNTRECLLDLEQGIESFLGCRLKRDKQQLVRNFENKELLIGKAGSLGWESERN